MKQVLLLLLLLVLSVVLYRWGRSLYMPVVNKLKPKLTVKQVHDNLSEVVWKRLSPSLQKAGMRNWPRELCYVAFKEERVLEVYGRLKETDLWTFVKSYSFTASSGAIGPKLKEGDRQIPEGIYEVEYLNPNSSFYLSMKINYPNAFDRAKGEADGRTDLGSDIFIHGKAVTVGCIPVGDEAIEELFLLTAQLPSKSHRVIIAPHDFRQKPEYPEVPDVAWSDEVYDKLTEELKLYAK